MAEGLLRSLGGDRVDVSSAGTVATRVHPLAISTMAARGIDLGRHSSKHLDAFAGQAFDVVITVCDSARESCPFFPGAPERIHWSLADPSAAPSEGAVAAFAAVADDLAERIRAFLAGIPRRGVGRASGSS
jgi:arsenate reductase